MQGYKRVHMQERHSLHWTSVWPKTAWTGAGVGMGKTEGQRQTKRGRPGEKLLEIPESGIGKRRKGWVLETRKQATAMPRVGSGVEHSAAQILFFLRP